MRSSLTAERRLWFFGGKGGVGKTTCAAAAAISFEFRVSSFESPVLVLSLDPAHSLTDVLGTNPKPETRNSKLTVLELDARAEFGEFMRRHRHDLRTVADRGTYFDDEDIQGFLDLSLPGLDEIMGLLKLGELARADGGRRIVVDLPPTGHALRLFDVSEAFDQLVAALELMQDKHRFAVSSLVRRYSTDAIDGFLDDLRASCGAARRALTAPEVSAFVLVTRPEPMVLAETARYAGRLRAAGVEPAALVLNMARGAIHLPPELQGLPTVCVPALRQPPVGARGLALVAEALGPLLGAKPAEPSSAAAGKGRTPSREKREMGREMHVGGSVRPSPAAAGEGRVRVPAAGDDHARGPRMERGWASRKAARQGSSPSAQNDMVYEGGSIAPLLQDPRRLTIFGGKGGVGKTTLAAATALGLARRDPGRSVVVLSIDPAHSLGDSLGQPLGDDARQVNGMANLQAIELDPARHWQAFKEHWEAEGEQLFGGLPGAGRFDPVYDRQIAEQLGKVQPTGLDELQAALCVIDLLDEDADRLVVVDSAPTGHLLRFLESPRLVIDWAKELMHILLKYGLAARLKQLSEDLLELSRKTKRLDGLLHDPALCEVVVVAMPEGPVLAETERLVRRLQDGHIAVRHVVLNQVQGPVDGFGKRHPELRTIEIGRRAEPIQGLRALERLAA